MKGKRTDLGGAECGIARALDVIGDWWSLLIVRDALQGCQRFGELQKSLGIAKNILSTRLKKLVAEEIFMIEPDAGSPGSHRYILSRKGEALAPILLALWQWGETNCVKSGELKYILVDVANERPLPKMQPLAQDGRTLGPRDFQVKMRDEIPLSTGEQGACCPERR